MTWPGDTGDTKLEDARRDRLARNDEVQRAWQTFQEKKQAVENAGAKAADVSKLERDDYPAYQQAARAFETADQRYRDLLERKAEVEQTGASTVEALNLFRNLKASALGDHEAYRRMVGGAGEVKGWVEGTDTAGGYLVNPAIVPGYLEALRANSPLRNRFTNVSVNSNEVWVTLENGTVTVQHLAEAAVKPDTTGSLTQKISTIHKVAGTTRVSDELLEDSGGFIVDLIGSQFAKQIGITIDKAIVSGTGTGEPTGIRNAAGVTSTAVDGQGATALYNSILKAGSRLREDFLEPDTVVVHPRDLVKFELTLDTTGRYIFEGGIQGALPNGMLVADANIPTNLGAGTNESIAIVGNMKQGGYFFSRTPLSVEASRDAGWQTDETVFRGVERYGFAVVRAQAFEILTGILP